MRESAWELYQRQSQRLDDRQTLLARRENFSDESRGGRLALSDELAAAASRAQPIYNEFQTSAPSPLAAEDGRSYRLRIIDELKKHSSRHGNLSLRAIADLNEDAFSAIEGEVLSDAMEAGKAFAPPNTLRPREIQRADGTRAVEYAGSPLVWLSHYMAPARAVRVMRGPNRVPITPSRSFIGKIA
jgi:hypothetical protein